MGVLRVLCQGFSIIFLTISILVFFFQSLVYGFIIGSVPYQYSELMLTTIERQGYDLELTGKYTQEELYNQLIKEFKEQVEDVNTELKDQGLDGVLISQKLQDGNLDVKSADIKDEGWLILYKIKNVGFNNLTDKQKGFLVKEPSYVELIRFMLSWLPLLLVLFSILLIYLGWWALMPYTEEDEMWDALSEAYDRKQRYIHSEDDDYE